MPDPTKVGNRIAFRPFLRRTAVAGWAMCGDRPGANPEPMTTAPATNPADTTARRNETARREDPGSIRPESGVSLPRLYALRAAYLIIAVGLALVKWPSLFNHPQPWPLFEGVETCMLVALSLLWFLGIRYPLQLLPALLFELAWKIIWTIFVVVPLWRSDQLDPATCTCSTPASWSSSRPPSFHGATCSPTT